MCSRGLWKRRTKEGLGLLNVKRLPRCAHMKACFLTILVKDVNGHKLADAFSYLRQP